MHNVLKFLTDNKGKSFTIRQIVKNTGHDVNSVFNFLSMLSWRRVIINDSGCYINFKLVKYKRKNISKWYIA